jgi:hypothetical protein
MRSPRYFVTRQAGRQYHASPALRIGLDSFGIKQQVVPNDVFSALLRDTELISENVGVDTLDGTALAKNAHEAFGDKFLHSMTEVANTWPARYLTKDDLDNGVTNLLLVPKSPVAGHFYMSVIECPLSDALLAALGDAEGIDALKWAIATFLAFPGCTRQPFSVRERAIESGHEDLVNVLAVHEGPDLELGFENQVYITSAASLTTSKRLGALGWCNSTGALHAFDGRVYFVNVPDPAGKKLRLVAVGFGAHPWSGGDSLNVLMGTPVFTVMVETFVAALEQHVARTKATKLTTEDLIAVATALETDKVRLGKLLATKHVLFETMNLLGGPLRWTRLIAGGDTTAPPSVPHKSTK